MTKNSIFSSLSDGALYSYYSSENWGRLSAESKLELLQETADRETRAYGDTYSVQVRLDNLDPGVFGSQSGRNVAMSAELVEDGKISYMYGDRKIETDVPDSGWKSLETLLHEVRHTWQDEVSAGRIDAADGLKEIFEANNFTVSDIDGQKGLHYMQGETGYEMYLLNPTEADAYRYSQQKTAQIVMARQQEGFIDPTMETYLKGLETEGYERSLAEIKSIFGEDADKQVENTLKNIYNGKKESVNPQVEKAVKAEMVASYQASLAKSDKIDTAATAKAESTEPAVSLITDEKSGILDNDPADFTGTVPAIEDGAAREVQDAAPAADASPVQGLSDETETGTAGVETSGAADGTGECEVSDASDSLGSDEGSDDGLDN